MSEHVGALVSVIRTGIENFINVLRENGGAPISFQRFLAQTGLFLDRYILATSRQEGLNYVGGRMVLQLDHDEYEAVDAIPIRLLADLYFQTADGQWIVKQKQGQVSNTRFTDWDTDEMSAALQQTESLELSVEPPLKAGVV